MRIRTAASLFIVCLAACEGPTGPPGNANVTSGTFTVLPTAYINDFWYFGVEGGTQANPAKVATVAVPELTADLVNVGAVLVYFRVPSGPTQPADEWTLLPFHQGGFGGGYLVSIKAAVDVGQIRIGYAHETTSSTTAPNVYTVTLPTYEFRWVAIQGTGVAQAGIATSNN